MEVSVKIYNKSENSLPAYESGGSAGMDLKAFVPEKTILQLKPGERILVDTGLYIELPEGYEAQVRPRSGLALKKGITVLNTPGTIDADYRGSIGVILINLGNDVFEIRNGDRIAQLVLNEVPKIKWDKVSKKEDLSNTTRGLGGFGSTGK
jgi:dUTP pyrophosphatase